MKKIYLIILIVIANNIYSSKIQAQSLPVGTIGIEDYYRRKQLLGEIDSTISFSIRPLFPNILTNTRNIYDPDSTLNSNSYFSWSGAIPFANRKGVFQILPIVWQQQYNSHHPYGWNDGAMIPARGYQTTVSAGLFVKFGPLSIQLRPEIIYAQNKSFEGFAQGKSDDDLTNYYILNNLIDNPERFGTGSYKKVLWGQSNIRLTFGPVSLGLSNENIWWGPGMRNSIMMTNNAPGFKHITLNTVKPVKTGIGSFEAQIIAGRLEASGASPLNGALTSRGQDLFQPFRDDWRYLTGFNINYQPKWVPGLFVGFIRDFMSYHNDNSGLSDYLPYFSSVQKAGNLEGDPISRDQRLALYARWLFQKAHAEIYFEYGLNDNSYNYRDFLGSPDHGRSYIFGFNKLIRLQNTKEQFIEINAEVTQMSQSVDRLVRSAGGFYQHYQVRQGYTNLGQVLGAGTGSGGNIQSLNVSWRHALKSFGIGYERFEHMVDLSDFAFPDINGNSRRWVDFALSLNGQYDYKNFIFSAKIQGIKSLNYQWRLHGYSPDQYYIPNNDVFNLHGELGVTFRF
jgi:hypothetical protein